MVVPGSQQVKAQAEQEGLDEVFTSAGFEWREAGCSMCLGMNPDILQPGERCASTSNRNFEGRQGRGGRTHLVSPQMAAAAAIEGHFVDIREWDGHDERREPGAVWQQEDVVDGFIDERRKLIPLFDVQEELAQAADHARRPRGSTASSTSAPATAASPSWCWTLYPESTGVLVDFSEPMLAAAQRAAGGQAGPLGDRRRATSPTPAWRDGAAARASASTRSCRASAIHHLPDERKRDAVRGGVRAARAGRPLPELGARRDRRASRRDCSTSTSASA